MSWARRRSRSGCSADEQLELADELAVAPRARSASMRSWSASRRSSSSRPISALRPRLVGELGERRPAPEREGLPQAAGSRPPASRARALGHEPLEAVQVETDPASTTELVAGGDGADRARCPSALRSWETYVWRTFAAVAGGRPAQSSSISRSRDTGSFAWRSRIARSARGFAASGATTRPSATTSSGPRMRKSIETRAEP